MVNLGERHNVICSLTVKLVGSRAQSHRCYCQVVVNIIRLTQLQRQKASLSPTEPMVVKHAVSQEAQIQDAAQQKTGRRGKTLHNL